MRAILYDPSAPHGLRLGQAPDPIPGRHEALLEVHAIALNFGEIAFLAAQRPTQRSGGMGSGRRRAPAGGGVGRMAVQLAARAGAHVVASVSQLARGVDLAELGAAEVVVGLSGVAPVYGVIENVGGRLLAEAYALVEPEGWVQSIGVASLEPTAIDFEQARVRGGGRIEAFNVFSHGGAFGKDLRHVAAVGGPR